MKHIVFLYPSKNRSNVVAAYTRLINIAKLFIKCQCIVTIITLDDGHSIPFTDNNNIHYLFVRKSEPKMHGILSKSEFTRLGYDFFDACNLLNESNPISSVFLVGGYWALAKAFCKNKSRVGYQIGFMINDWLQLSKLSLSEKINVFIGRNFFYHKLDSVITVSKWLNKKYKHIEKQLTIPAIFDKADFPLAKDYIKTTNNILLGYAGNIDGKKDRIDNLVKALYLLDEVSQNKIELHLVGVNKHLLERHLGKQKDILNKIKTKIVFHKNMEQQELYPFLQKFDFIPLFRYNLTYAKAGFPSKFAEGLILGVPFFANATGDMLSYMNNMKNSFLVKSAEPEEIKKAIYELLKLDKKAIESLHKKAYEEGVKSFTINSYIQSSEQFLCL